MGSKTSLAEQGKLPLKFTCPAGTSTCPATLLIKGELHCEDSARNITCRAWGKLGFCLDCPIAVFCRIHLKLAMGQVGMLHSELMCFTYPLFLVDGVDLLHALDLFLDLQEVRVHGNGEIEEAFSVREFLPIGLVFRELLLVGLHELDTVVQIAAHRTRPLLLETLRKVLQLHTELLDLVLSDLEIKEKKIKIFFFNFLKKKCFSKMFFFKFQLFFCHIIAKIVDFSLKLGIWDL